MEQFPTLSENDIANQQTTSDLLAELMTNLQAVSVILPGGFIQAKSIVQDKRNHGVPLPTALYESINEIIEGRHGTA